MRVIGVTGHVNVPEETVSWVVETLTARLQEFVVPGWLGITCLAKGADQIFAKVVLALQGRYDVVLPAHDYKQRMIDEGDGEPFCDLLERASGVATMPFDTSSRRAYLAASEAMLERCDVLLAVWDGRPSRRVGDTADVVATAYRRRVQVVRVWPDAADAAAPRGGAVGVRPAAVRGRG